MRVATCNLPTTFPLVYISIHATHAGGDFEQLPVQYRNLISIHATHAGGDSFYLPFLCTLLYFNPRHPCGWRRELLQNLLLLPYFNPRHPCGWRLDVKAMWLDKVFISIHATHAGGDDASMSSAFIDRISIHATHAGGDISGRKCRWLRYYFNPRHPCGWRPRPPTARLTMVLNFNPRHPCGWRPGCTA